MSATVDCLVCVSHCRLPCLCHPLSTALFWAQKCLAAIQCHGVVLISICIASCLPANGIIKHPKVAEVMKAVDRQNFCKNNPYMDSPQGIGYAVTISAPHMVRLELECWILQLAGYFFMICLQNEDPRDSLFFQHAHALEILSEHLVNGERALDVGSGSGYLTTCMALMVGHFCCSLVCGIQEQTVVGKTC